MLIISFENGNYNVDLISLSPGIWVLIIFKN